MHDYQGHDCNERLFIFSAIAVIIGMMLSGCFISPGAQLGNGKIEILGTSIPVASAIPIINTVTQSSDDPTMALISLLGGATAGASVPTNEIIRLNPDMSLNAPSSAFSLYSKLSDAGKAQAMELFLAYQQSGLSAIEWKRYIPLIMEIRDLVRAESPSMAAIIDFGLTHIDNTTVADETSDNADGQYIPSMSAIPHNTGRLIEWWTPAGKRVLMYESGYQDGLYADTFCGHYQGILRISSDKSGVDITGAKVKDLQCNPFFDSRFIMRARYVGTEETARVPAKVEYVFSLDNGWKIKFVNAIAGDYVGDPTQAFDATGKLRASWKGNHCHTYKGMRVDVRYPWVGDGKPCKEIQ